MFWESNNIIEFKYSTIIVSLIIVSRISSVMSFFVYSVNFVYFLKNGNIGDNLIIIITFKKLIFRFSCGISNSNWIFLFYLFFFNISFFIDLFSCVFDFFNIFLIILDFVDFATLLIFLIIVINVVHVG